MSERFNFYDIYGYLLPGSLLLALFWLPFGLGGLGWPNEEVSKALLLLFSAYIAGHLLQSLALVIVPSKFRDENKVLRNPSSILLDETNGKFTKSFKDDLGARIKDEFGLDILGTSEEDLKNRDTTLFQARAYLIRKKSGKLRRAVSRFVRDAPRVGVFFLSGQCISHRLGILFSQEGQVSRIRHLATPTCWLRRRRRSKCDFYVSKSQEAPIVGPLAYTIHSRYRAWIGLFPWHLEACC